MKEIHVDTQYEVWEFSQNPELTLDSFYGAKKVATFEDLHNASNYKTPSYKWKVITEIKTIRKVLYVQRNNDAT